jgi:ubiquinol-cytochrome c reductase iron-sulfur subunit
MSGWNSAIATIIGHSEFPPPKASVCFAAATLHGWTFRDLDVKKPSGLGEELRMSAVGTVETTRRDFLYITTAAVGAVGAAAAMWPLIDQMNPDASVLALATVEVDLAPLAEGQGITVKWRGNPVFIRYRTAKEIEEARAVAVDDLPDTQARNANLPDSAIATDENRVLQGKEQFIVMMGVCTHLGCVPLGQAGEYGGWFCPCHGSHYDTSGRIRKGPAPENLAIPKYAFIDDVKIRIG